MQDVGLSWGKAWVPKAVDDAFRDPQTDAERQIKASIDRFNAEHATKLEQELFKQRTRLADAKRTLQTKVTKAATASSEQPAPLTREQWLAAVPGSQIEYTYTSRRFRRLVQD